MQGDHLGTIQDRLERASVYDINLLDDQDGSKRGVPSLEHEELRRQLRNNVQEMW